jgi:long-chain acyl-CoA synthetase
MQDDDYFWQKSYPDGLDYQTPLSIKPLHELLLESAHNYPDNICLDFKGRLYSYREIAHKAKCFAHSLQQMGAQKGAHIGLFMPNCPQFVIAYYGALMAGCVVVNYNPLYSKTELANQINDSNTEIMVTLNIAMLYDKISPLLAEDCFKQTCLKKVIIGDLSKVLPKSKAALYKMLKWKELSHVPDDDKHYQFAKLLQGDEIANLPQLDPISTIAVLQYTGGTTGVPKGVMLSHANLVANVEMCARWFFNARLGHETIMGVLPFFHVFAMTAIMNYGISCGFRIILHPRFEMKALLHDITRKKPTIMAGVPTMFAAMLNYPKLAEYNLSSLQMCISGGAGLPLEVKKNFESATNCTLVEGYGLSESSPVVACNPLVGVNKAGSIGLPFPHTEIVIMDKDDGTTKLAIGEVGEICIRGAQVMLGYWNNPNATNEVLRDNLLYSGDIGYMDNDGYVFVVDRKKEMIISCGYNIYPRQIEEALYTHPNVLECAVIGIADQMKGEVPKAFIVKRAGTELTQAELRTYLKGRIAAYAVPHEYEFVESLPKSIIGKILKKEL